MLDINFIRKNSQKVAEAAKNKGAEINIKRVLDLDKQRRELVQKAQSLREKRNEVAKQKFTDETKEEGKKIKDELKVLETQLGTVENELNDLLLLIPNLPAPDVKVGKDESENEVIKTWGEPKKFSFKVRDHLELGELLDIIDVKRASKVSGARFTYLKNQGALLEFALVRYALDTLIQEGFMPIIPPTLIKKEVMRGLGYMEHGGLEEDMFAIEGGEHILVGTAEQSVVPIHKDELFQKKDLPKRYVAYSSSFRKEAGSYGKDTKGIWRMHEFHKVEMVSFVTDEDGDKEHEYLLSLEEKFFQSLKLPYQVVKMCTGDLGFPAARKYDINVWIPSHDKYRELTSTSTTTDFQSRRLNTKYQDGSDKKYAQILNGTAFAMSRTPVAILENYQQEDGSVLIPEVLQPYIGFDKISPK